MPSDKFEISPTLIKEIGDLKAYAESELNILAISRGNQELYELTPDIKPGDSGYYVHALKATYNLCVTLEKFKFLNDNYTSFYFFMLAVGTKTGLVSNLQNYLSELGENWIPTYVKGDERTLKLVEEFYNLVKRVSEAKVNDESELIYGIPEWLESNSETVLKLIGSGGTSIRKTIQTELEANLRSLETTTLQARAMLEAEAIDKETKVLLDRFTKLENKLTELENRNPVEGQEREHIAAVKEVIKELKELIKDANQLIQREKVSRDPIKKLPDQFGHYQLGGRKKVTKNVHEKDSLPPIIEFIEQGLQKANETLKKLNKQLSKLEEDFRNQKIDKKKYEAQSNYVKEIKKRIDDSKEQISEKTKQLKELSEKQGKINSDVEQARESLNRLENDRNRLVNENQLLRKLQKGVDQEDKTGKSQTVYESDLLKMIPENMGFSDKQIKQVFDIYLNGIANKSYFSRNHYNLTDMQRVITGGIKENKSEILNLSQQINTHKKNIKQSHEYSREIEQVKREVAELNREVEKLSEDYREEGKCFEQYQEKLIKETVSELEELVEKYRKKYQSRPSETLRNETDEEAMEQKANDVREGLKCLAHDFLTRITQIKELVEIINSRKGSESSTLPEVVTTAERLINIINISVNEVNEFMDYHQHESESDIEFGTRMDEMIDIMTKPTKSTTGFSLFSKLNPPALPEDTANMVRNMVKGFQKVTPSEKKLFLDQMYELSVMEKGSQRAAEAIQKLANEMGKHLFEQQLSSQERQGPKKG